MKTLAQTPSGWEWIDVPDPEIPPKTELQLLSEDVQKIKEKLGI